MQSFQCHNEIFYIFVQYTFSSVWENSAELKGENQYRWDNYETHSDSQKRYDNMTSIILTIISARVKFASSWHIQNRRIHLTFHLRTDNLIKVPFAFAIKNTKGSKIILSLHTRDESGDIFDSKLPHITFHCWWIFYTLRAWRVDKWIYIHKSVIRGGSMHEKL